MVKFSRLLDKDVITVDILDQLHAGTSGGNPPPKSWETHKLCPPNKKSNYESSLDTLPGGKAL